MSRVTLAGQQWAFSKTYELAALWFITKCLAEVSLWLNHSAWGVD